MNVRISTEKKDINFDKLHNFLSQRSYWSKGIPKSILQKGIENSVCFSILDKENQFLGFARVITDMSTFGYLADVYIEEDYRGKGLGKKLVEYIMNYDDFKYFRNWFLYTLDAHSLYSQFGWKSLDNVERAMVIKKDAQLLYSNFN